MSLVKGKEDTITLHMNVEKLNPYGLRKGSATHAVSGTTATPSIPSIARRGEWSIGSVLDCYWHFGSVGDQYLGRILAGLNPNEVKFSVLPPHWDAEEPLENASIREALHAMYSPLLEQYASRVENPIGILLRCLACIVYHSKRMIQVMAKNPGHDFSKLPILQNEGLLERLRPLVTIEPTKGELVRLFVFLNYVALTFVLVYCFFLFYDNRCDGRTNGSPSTYWSCGSVAEDSGVTWWFGGAG